jgi:hypothetical protein
MTKRIEFKFSFERGPLDRTNDTGISELRYATLEFGGPTQQDYVVMSLDYITRIYWAFDTQNKLQVLNMIYDEITSIVKLGNEQHKAILKTAGAINKGLNVYKVFLMNVEDQDKQERLEAWCDGIEIKKDENNEARIKVISAVTENGRMIQNPFKFSFFNRPTLNEHLETLNFVIGFTMNQLKSKEINRFVSQLRQVFDYCQTNPGFWRGEKGIISSQRLVDRVLRDSVPM